VLKSKKRDLASLGASSTIPKSISKKIGL